MLSARIRRMPITFQAVCFDDPFDKCNSPMLSEATIPTVARRSRQNIRLFRCSNLLLQLLGLLSVAGMISQVNVLERAKGSMGTGALTSLRFAPWKGNGLATWARPSGKWQQYLPRKSLFGPWGRRRSEMNLISRWKNIKFHQISTSFTLIWWWLARVWRNA